MRVRKVLIVYGHAGEGHKRKSRILQDVLGDVEGVMIETATSFDLAGKSQNVRIVEIIWNYLLRKGKFVAADLTVNFLTRLFVAPIQQSLYVASPTDHLALIAPDVIVSTMPWINKELGDYAREKGIPFFNFISDVNSFIDNVHPDATHICLFNESEASIRSHDFSKAYYAGVESFAPPFRRIKYLLRYMRDYLLNARTNPIYGDVDVVLKARNAARCVFVGPISERRHFAQKDLEVLREKYGVLHGTPNVVVLNGGAGGTPIEETLNRLQKGYHGPLNLFLMCGRDAEVLERVRAVRPPRDDITLYPFAFVDSVDEVLTLADCVICRCTAGAVSEAIINRTPLVVLGSPLSNDRGSLRVIRNHDIGAICETYDDLAAATRRVLENKEVHVANMERLAADYPQSYEAKKRLIQRVILGEVAA